MSKRKNTNENCLFISPSGAQNIQHSKNDLWNIFLQNITFIKQEEIFLTVVTSKYLSCHHADKNPDQHYLCENKDPDRHNRRAVKNSYWYDRRAVSHFQLYGSGTSIFAVENDCPWGKMSYVGAFWQLTYWAGKNCSRVSTLYGDSIFLLKRSLSF